MKVLLSSDIVLDVLLEEKEDAKSVFRLCEGKKVEGNLSAISLPLIHNALDENTSSHSKADILEQLNLVLKIRDLKADYVMEAASGNLSDLETAVLMLQARKMKASYIITDYPEKFTDSAVPPVTPKEFIQLAH